MVGSHPRAFLSYAREDGEEFATALRRRLESEAPEISLWQDRAELEGGVGWWTQIEAAIDRVKFLVIVLTPKAIASEMTRKEWRYARQRGVVVYPVKGVPDQQLEYVALPRWMRKAHFFDLGQFRDARWHDSREWETFIGHLRSDRQPIRVPFMAPDLAPRFVAREDEFDRVQQLLTNERDEQPVAVALHGGGGYGKTTLAVALCHDPAVVDAFDDGVLWTSLGQRPHLVDEVARLYEALTGQRIAFLDVADAATKLADKLENRNCLLVIDDVWDRAHLEPFLKGGRQCARLITTRRFDLVEDAARVRVDQMRPAEAVDVLSSAFVDGNAGDHDQLAALASRLGEWPLLLRLAASIMRKRVDRGDSANGALSYVVRALDKRGVIAFDQSESTQRDDAVRRTVSASLDQLSSDDHRRFRDLAILPKDTAVPLTTLERLWGLDDLDTVDSAQRLDDVSLLTLDLQRGVASIHDVMRMYLLTVVGDPSSAHARLVAHYGDVHHLPDAYAWRWLSYHMLHAGQHEDLRSLLLTPEWLFAKLCAVGPPALIRDFDLLPGDPDLEVIQASLRLSLLALTADPDQFAEQLLGRLPNGFSNRLDTFRGDLARTGPQPRLRGRWLNLDGPGGALVQTLPHEGIKNAMVLPQARVLTWGDDGTLREWDLGTGENRELKGHEGPVNGALLSPRGDVLSWSADKTLRFWDLAEGTVRAFTGHEDSVQGALLLPNGRAVSWSADRTLRTWNLATGSCQTLGDFAGIPYGACLLRDGQVVSWHEDGSLWVWNLRDGNAQPLIGHEASVYGALPLPNGGALSWSADGSLRMWDVETRIGSALRGHDGPVYGAALLPNGPILSWSRDATLRLWNPETRQALPLLGHDRTVHGALLLAEGRALSWSADGSMRVWDLTTAQSRTLGTAEGAVYGASLLADDRVLSWSDDRSLRVWDLRTAEGRTLTGHGALVYGALALPDARVLSWSADNTLRVWDLAKRDDRVPTGHSQWVQGASLTRGGRALSWSADGELRAWDLTTGHARALAGHDAWVYGALELHDDCALSWSADRTLRVWDLSSGDHRVLEGHRDAVHGALCLDDRRVLSWSADGALRLWDLCTNDSVEFTGHDDWVQGAIRISQSGVLSWGEDGSLRVWDLATRQARVLNGHSATVHGAVLVSEHTALSWSGDRTLRLWHLNNGTSRVLTGHQTWVKGVLLLAEQRALSWSGDATLLLWDLESGRYRRLAGHNGAINGALLLPDAQALSWSVDRTVRIWNLATGTSRPLLEHDGPVHGAIDASAGRVLSWSADRSIRLQRIDSEHQGLAFHFDAVPTVVLAEQSGGFLVGDALGRIHLLDHA